MPETPSPSSQWWFRAAGTEKVFGPVAPDVLLAWAREGRIFPEDKVSPDNAAWGDARQLAFLAMDTVIVRPDGRVLGPFHHDAVDALRKVGKVPPQSVVRSASELLSGADSAAAPTASAQAEKAFEARLDAVRNQARDALAEKAREAEAACAERDAARDELEAERGTTAALRQAVAKAENARAEAEAAAAGAREGAAGAEAARAEADSLREALRTAREDAADARGQVAREEAARAEALRDAEAARAETAAARADAARAVEAARAEAEEAAAAAKREANEAAQAEIAAANARRADEAAAAERARAEAAARSAEAEAAARERDASRAEAEAARAEAEAARAAAGEADAKAAAAAAAAAKSLAELESLRADNAELLAVSNARDLESKARIEALEARLRRFPDDPAVGAEPATELSETMARLDALQARVTDLTRERGELAEKLAAAEASLAVASRPVEGDFAVIRRFADEALDALRKELEEEKTRADAARAAAAERQNLLRDRVGALERALSRDPGEKSRAELEAERNEKTLAQLRQQLESEREQHKADLGRAAQSEKALEGRIRALQQRESAVREQLRRVEKRTADYDSLTSQLRRREQEVIEAAKHFSEAREQWQAVEQMLTSRISELEHGAGSLFDGAGAPRAEAAAAGADGAPAPDKPILPTWFKKLK